MPELLKLKTPEWELSIWCIDTRERLQTYERTMARRASGKNLPILELRLSSNIEALSVATMIEEKNGIPLYSVSDNPPNSVFLKSPIFFENMQYQFEWVFACKKIQDAYTEHRLKAVNDAFRFVKPQTVNDAPRLNGVVNTGNNIGWFKLPWCFQRNGECQRFSISFEVIPVKMDMHTDLPAMYATLDREFPLWRFSLAQRTQQSAAKSPNRGNFPLLWLAHFEALRIKMNTGLKIISSAPHSQLQQTDSHLRADKLKGKFASKLAERVIQDINQGSLDKRYRQSKKKLSVDTPENQFIKMVVDTMKVCLADFHQKLLDFNRVPEKQLLSSKFIDEVSSWQKPFTNMQKQGFLRDVGAFSGLSRESLVLQQKTGYSAVYRVWQELKFYLSLFAEQSTVSMKSIAEIYEVWCFLELRRLLIEDLHFNEFKKNKVRLSLKEFEFKLTDGYAGAFHFNRIDGIEVRLAHEPIFRKNGEPIRTFLVTQNPDILLEVKFPNGKKCIWLFDAKYRIKSHGNEDTLDGFDEESELVDFVPEDALNQMHRYRDALIYIESKGHRGGKQKSRPIFGAFALYPGFFDQVNNPNPYEEAIEEIGIGAFALLPCAESKRGHHWLSKYLESQIGLPNTLYTANKSNEALYVQESARISYYGMHQVLYPDLVMTVALGGAKGRNLAYFESFKNGTANFYHVQQDTFLGKFKLHVVNELRFLALGITSSFNSNTKIIEWLWPIKNVTLKPRNLISEEQSGKLSTSEELYYLFELGKPLALKDTLINVPHRPIQNSMKLTTVSRIDRTRYFGELETVYQDAMA